MRPVGALAVLLLAACGGVPATAPSAPGEIGGTVTVLAAASLTDALNKASAAFRGSHRVDIEVSYGGSSTLVSQLTNGAPGDLFLSADQANMDRAVAAGLIAGQPVVFATNRLEIAVAPGNPKHIQGLPDLARSDVVTVLCAPVVPCGAYAAQVLGRQNLKIAARSQEADVKSVLSKVRLGEADAGIVYATDVRGAAGVQGVGIPAAQNVIATYPGAVLKTSTNPAAAHALLDYLTSTNGQLILGGYGFGPARP